jgi:hypothetical protein
LQHLRDLALPHGVDSAVGIQMEAVEVVGVGYSQDRKQRGSHRIDVFAPDKRNLSILGPEGDKQQRRFMHCLGKCHINDARVC